MRLRWTSAWKAKLGGVLHSLSLSWTSCRRRLSGQAGQTLAEYAILLGGTASIVVLSAVLVFRGSITSAFGSATDCVLGTCVVEQVAPVVDDDDDNDNDDDDDDDDAGNSDHCNDGHGQDGDHGNCDD